MGGEPSRCAPLSRADAGPGCVPRTCEQQGINCGPAGDGCGGSLQCGTCASGLTCGGGGMPGRCGAPGCTPRTCESAGANCGPVSNGCGGLLQCGTCPAGQSCGGGGRPSVCGTPSGATTCTPRTCGSVGANCGPVSDGCGGLLECGTCPAGQSCGGGGRPSVCGTGGGADAGVTCVRRTCMSAGANCGPVSDGCGGLLTCGTCPAGQTCGGGGRASVCGAPTCVRRTCEAAGANCGPVADGCGGLLQCGECAPGESCGAVRPSVCGTRGGSTTCTGLCQMRATCAPGVVTTISGTVVTPAVMNPDPLYNAVVYIPNAAVAPFAPGVACERCGAATSGSPVVSAVTGPDGRFVLRDVPVGADVPLVVQIGRWRRQVRIPMVRPCVDNALDASLTRLPRNRTEGDIPLTAMVTGDVDALECVLRKIGVEDREFTTPAGGGRIQAVANGATAGRGTSRRRASRNLDLAALARYDMVLFACEAHNDKPTTAQQNLVRYADAGGRVFATHFSYTCSTTSRLSSVALEHPAAQPGQPPRASSTRASARRGLRGVAAHRRRGLGHGQISIVDPRHDVDAVVAPTASVDSTVHAWDRAAPDLQHARRRERQRAVWSRAVQRSSRERREHRRADLSERAPRHDPHRAGEGAGVHALRPRESCVAPDPPCADAVHAADARPRARTAARWETGAAGCSMQCGTCPDRLHLQAARDA
ncbi:MAG: hypothetical protein U0325_00370 [Polyangiales bacterium]